MLGLIRILLGPILLVQGARVRRNIVRLPEPEGPREGGKGELSLLILGDSSAAGVGVDRQEDALSGRIAAGLAPVPVRWKVLATTGWTTADTLAAVQAMDPGRFDAAVICLGVNEVTTETGIPAWIETYGRLLDLLCDRHGTRRAYLSGVPPMGRFPALPQPLRWYLGRQAIAHDRALAAMALARPDARHLPVESDLPPTAAASDGYHPGPLVYAELAERFAGAIRADLEAGAFGVT